MGLNEALTSKATKGLNMKDWYCPKLTVLAVNVLAVFLLTSIAVGQETTEEMSAESEEGETEGVIEIEGLAIIGSRLQARSVEESAVPIDILDAGEFVKQGGTDLPDLMRNVVPSYNVNAHPSRTRRPW